MSSTGVSRTISSHRELTCFRILLCGVYDISRTRLRRARPRGWPGGWPRDCGPPRGDPGVSNPQRMREPGSFASRAQQDDKNEEAQRYRNDNLLQ